MSKFRIINFILIIFGTAMVGVGILGIFLPLLPATPFFLLAAASYAKSSTKFYNWLTQNKWFGAYIRNYSERKSIPLSAKIISVTVLWITIICSIIFIDKQMYLNIILGLIAIGVTIHIFRFKTLKE